MTVEDIKVGSWVLVDAAPYLHRPGLQWGEVRYISPGTASVYPLKVEFINGLGGQYKHSEVQQVSDTRPSDTEV